MENALIEAPAMRLFAGIELISDRIPDVTTILTVRHRLEKHELGEQIFETVKASPQPLSCCMAGREEAGDGRQVNGVSGGHASRQAPSLPDTPDGKLQELNETAKAHPRCKVNVLAALTNLFLARRQLLGTQSSGMWCT